LCRGIQIDSFDGSKRNLCFQASFQIRGIFNKDVTALDGSLEEEFNEMPFRARNINFQPKWLALLKFAFGLQMLSSNFMNQPRNCCAQQWLRLLHFEIAGIGTTYSRNERRRVRGLPEIDEGQTQCCALAWLDVLSQLTSRMSDVGKPTNSLRQQVKFRLRG
jgi:hypothetical protein